MKTKLLEIIQFTDPVCTWCWGSEPVLRALESRYGDQLKVHYIMGGLVKDITAFYDSQNDIGGTPEGSNANIARHWLEASARHGMPVEVKGFKLFSSEYRSTYPQNIAYKAAQLQDPVKADRFLRRIREASAAEAQQTNVTAVLVGLAAEAGLDLTKFIDDFSNGKAQKAFEEDLYITAQYRVHGFPGFLLKYGEKSILLRGYQRYEDFNAVISSLSNGEILETALIPAAETILDFIKNYKNVAPAEISMAFRISSVEVDGFLSGLLEKNLIKKTAAGNGYFYSIRVNPMVCDSDSGTCSL